MIDRCVQICGGDGVSDGLPLAQYLNEVRPFRIYDGANETHKWAIARRASSRRRKAVEAGFDSPFLVEHYGGDGLGVCAQNRDYIRQILRGRTIRT